MGICRFNWATSQQKWIVVKKELAKPIVKGFQLGHFLAEMDSLWRSKSACTSYPTVSIGPLLSRNGQVIADNQMLDTQWGFNWATSQQKWIGESHHECMCHSKQVFQLGHFLAEMDRSGKRRAGQANAGVSIGPLLSRNGQMSKPELAKGRKRGVSIGPLLSRNGQL